MAIAFRVRTMAARAVLAMLCVWIANTHGPHAFAAEPVPLTGGPMEVQVWPGGEPGRVIFIVTGHLPAGTPLPAAVRLPLPDAAQVFWSGEILGGPLEADPARQYVVVETPTGRALEFTAEETRTVQYEAAGNPLGFEDGLFTARFEWMQSVPVDEVVFSVRIPANVEEVRIEPRPTGPPVFNEAGDRLYVLTPIALPEGVSREIVIEYGGQGAGTAGAAGERLVGWIGLALGAAVVALVLVLVRERSRRAQGDTV